MALKANSAEGGTDGTTVTTGNSGGASGDAWSAVTIGASATLKYTTAQQMHGGLSYELVNASGVTTHADWTGYATTQFATRMYFRVSATPGADLKLIDVRTSSASVCELLTTSSNKLRIRTNGSATTLYTSVSSISANTWYRAEVVCERLNASNATFKFDYYLGDSLTPVETGYSSTTVSSGGTNNIDRVLYGQAATNTFTGTLWFDGVAALDGSLTYLGPFSSSAPVRRVQPRHVSLGLSLRP